MLLAGSRGAVSLIVVPQFEPEEPGERELHGRILEERHLTSTDALRPSGQPAQRSRGERADHRSLQRALRRFGQFP